MTTTTEALAQIDRAVDTLRPEAREMIDMIAADPIPTTQDSYGRVMRMLTALGDEGGPLFLIALAREGYPNGTALKLAQIMGYTATVWALIEREGNR